MWKALMVALLVSLGAAGHAQAQTKKELVAKLIQLQLPGIENVGRGLAGQTAQRVLQSVGQAIPRLPADKRDAVAKEVQADVKKFYDEIEPLLRKRSAELAAPTLAPIYEERFSDDELKQVIAWLESPVSKKFQQLDGEASGTLAQKVVDNTRTTIEARLKSLEASLGKRLAVAPAPAGGNAASAPKK